MQRSMSGSFPRRKHHLQSMDGLKLKRRLDMPSRSFPARVASSVVSTQMANLKSKLRLGPNRRFGKSLPAELRFSHTGQSSCLTALRCCRTWRSTASLPTPQIPRIESGSGPPPDYISWAVNGTIPWPKNSAILGLESGSRVVSGCRIRNARCAPQHDALSDRNVRTETPFHSASAHALPAPSAAAILPARGWGAALRDLCEQRDHHCRGDWAAQDRPAITILLHSGPNEGAARNRGATSLGTPLRRRLAYPPRTQWA